MVEYIKFYGAGKENGFLSNLYEKEIYYNGMSWDSVESAYQFSKFKFKYRSLAYAIITMPTQKYVAKVGHLFNKDARIYYRNDWATYKLEIMYKLLEIKFQDPELRQKLLATGEKEIIEYSPYDKFWGWGKDHTGENHLGRLLMHLRASIEGKLV